jgi:hypothetical protein
MTSNFFKGPTHKTKQASPIIQHPQLQHNMNSSASAVKLNVTIPSVETFFQNDKPFSVYCVRISHQHGGERGVEMVSWKVFHEYKHFFDLHEQLKAKYPKDVMQQLVPFPYPKTQFSQLVQSLSFHKPVGSEVNKKKQELKEYLQSLVDHPQLRADEEVKKCLFLRDANFVSRFQTLGRIREKKDVKMVDPFTTEHAVKPAPVAVVDTPAPLSAPNVSLDNRPRAPYRSRSDLNLVARNPNVNSRESGVNHFMLTCTLIYYKLLLAPSSKFMHACFVPVL